MEENERDTTSALKEISIIEKLANLKLKIKLIFSKKEHHIVIDDDLMEELLEESFPLSDSSEYNSKTQRHTQRYTHRYKEFRERQLNTD